MEFDFAENTEVSSIDSVPEDFRGLYVRDGDEGPFKLNSEDAGVKSAVAAITRLNTSLKASRAEAKANKGKQIDLSALSDFGSDPDSILEGFNNKIAELNESLKAKGGKDLERQVDKIKQDLAQAHAKDLEGKDNRIGALTGQLHALLVTNEATSALAEAGALDSDLALPFITKQVKVDETDGNFKVNVVDDAGDVRYSGVTGQPMSIKELVAEMKGKDKFGPLFKSEAPKGGGTPPQGGNNRGAHKVDPQNMSSVDKISAGLQKGQAQRAGRGRAA